MFKLKGTIETTVVATICYSYGTKSVKLILIISLFIDSFKVMNSITVTYATHIINNKFAASFSF